MPLRGLRVSLGKLFHDLRHPVCCTNETGSFECLQKLARIAEQ